MMLGGHAQVAASMTEAELQTAILGTTRNPGIADTYGWLGYHTHRSDRSPAGFPDLVLVRECVIFAELKRQNGRTRPAQVTWLDRLEQADAVVYLWRPIDLLDGTIARILAPTPRIR